jgi:ParB family transcriptional regulator, chromosome partitioning protein
MNDSNESIVRMIPLDRIKVLNPRQRNRHKFQQIVNNISNLGLKRPITVNASKSKDGTEQYDLVCGQGRLEAFAALGQTSIPAVVIRVTKEECYLMSLVENLARRQHVNLELVREIGNLKNRGYKVGEIAQKTDLTPDYVRGIIRLLERGEERLINAVETGYIPISLAVEISAAKDEDAQLALLSAYESKKLRGRELIKVRRLIEQRRIRGKSIRSGLRISSNSKLTAHVLVRTYRQEVERQTSLIKKAKLCEVRLVFIVSALKQLFEDENFVNLLRAESIDSLPKYIADQIKIRGKDLNHEQTSRAGI